MVLTHTRLKMYPIHEDYIALALIYLPFVALAVAGHISVKRLAIDVHVRLTRLEEYVEAEVDTLHEILEQVRTTQDAEQETLTEHNQKILAVDNRQVSQKGASATLRQQLSQTEAAAAEGRRKAAGTRDALAKLQQRFDAHSENQRAETQGVVERFEKTERNLAHVICNKSRSNLSACDVSPFAAEVLYPGLLGMIEAVTNWGEDDVSAPAQFPLERIYQQQQQHHGWKTYNHTDWHTQLFIINHRTKSRPDHPTPADTVEFRDLDMLGGLIPAPGQQPNEPTQLVSIFTSAGSKHVYFWDGADRFEEIKSVAQMTENHEHYNVNPQH